MNECLSCGKPVKNKYCNVSCQNRHQRRKPTKEQCEKSHNTRFGEFKKFIVTCHKCNKDFEVVEREKLHPQKEKYHCSRSCANSRIHTEETKLKTSNSIRKLIVDGKAPGALSKYNNIRLTENKEKHLKVCLFCEKEFVTKNINQKYCSLICSSKNNIKLATIRQKEIIKENPNYWSEINKKSYENGHNFVAGGTSRWYDYKNIKVQGTYELRTCYILDRWKDEGRIKNWEYTNDRIKYIGKDNKEHSYILDFKVFKNNDMFYYLETKGYIRENDEEKWKTTRERGFDLKVWFEEDIIKNEK